MKNTEHLIDKIVKNGAKKPLPKIKSILTLAFLLFFLYYLSVFMLIQNSGAPLILKGFFTVDAILMFITGCLALMTTCKLVFPDGCLTILEKITPFIPFGITLIYFIFLTISYDLEVLISCIKLGDYKCFISMLKISVLPAVLSSLFLAKGFPTQHHWAGINIVLSVASFSYVILRLFETPLNPLQVFIWHYIPVVLFLSLGVLIGNFIKK
jgi:hypothetical protein